MRVGGDDHWACFSKIRAYSRVCVSAGAEAWACECSCLCVRVAEVLSVNSND